MSLVGNRRRKKSWKYKILIVPEGDGGVTKSVKAGKWGFALWGGAVCAVFFLFVFLAFRYTPLGRFVGLGTAQAVDSVGNETDRRIRALAEEIAVLKDYNTQLRKALGERTGVESSQQQVESQKNEPSKVDTPKDDGQLSEEVYSAPPVTEIQSTTVREGVQASFPLLTPVNGVVTQGFDLNQKHYGIDFAAKEGTSVHAAAQGYVVFGGWTYEYGYTLILSHAGGYVTAYKHNSTLLKGTGSFVRRGELISLVGSTGKTSKGPHLHFEVLKDGFPVDPQLFLLNLKSTL